MLPIRVTAVRLIRIISNHVSQIIGSSMEVESSAPIEESITLMERDLNDMWTVSVTVSNAGPALATDAMLTDVLPDGVVYIEGSASLNGVAVPDEVTACHTLTVRLGLIGKGEQLELRYRVRATQPAQLSGGGAVSVNVHDTDLNRSSMPTCFYRVNRC